MHSGGGTRTAKRRMTTARDGEQYGRRETETLVPHSMVDPDDHCQLDDRLIPADDHDDQIEYRPIVFRHRQCCFLSRALSVEKMGLSRVRRNKYLNHGQRSHEGLAYWSL